MRRGVEDRRSDAPEEEDGHERKHEGQDGPEAEEPQDRRQVRRAQRERRGDMSSERVKAFGREVRRRRMALNMSLEALAEAAGLSGVYVGEIEASSRRPRGLSLDAAFRVAEGLGVELPELLGFQGLSGAGIEAGRIVSTLGPKLRIGVLALLRAIALEKGRAR